jgi:hypothetical protein
MHWFQEPQGWINVIIAIFLALLLVPFISGIQGTASQI